jgi:hypothetical protein
MRVRVLTVVAAVLLAACAAAWLRSYLPEYWTLRAHQGSLVLLFYGTDAATHIDPANHPSVEETFGNPQYPGRPTRRWDTEQALRNARSWAKGSARATPPPLSWRAAGFELIANHAKLSAGYFIVAAPFWALCLPPAGVMAWGLSRWRRQRRWRDSGRCRNCGYDLRGSSDACPECGTQMARQTSAGAGDVTQRLAN